MKTIVVRKSPAVRHAGSIPATRTKHTLNKDNPMWGSIKRFFGYHEIVTCITFDTGIQKILYVPFEGEYELIQDHVLESHIRSVLAGSQYGNIVSVDRYGMY